MLYDTFSAFGAGHFAFEGCFLQVRLSAPLTSNLKLEGNDKT